MKKPKEYRLLKDAPGVKSGEILKWNKYLEAYVYKWNYKYEDIIGTAWIIGKKEMMNFVKEGWFEPVPERIELDADWKAVGIKITDEQIDALCAEYLKNFFDLTSFKKRKVIQLEAAFVQGGNVIMNYIINQSQSTIPITPERLERAGFEPNGKNRWMMTGILFDIVFNSISDPEFVGRSEGYYLLKAGIILNDIAIEYIHHLDNTIRDLTGKDLNLFKLSIVAKKQIK